MNFKVITATVLGAFLWTSLLSSFAQPPLTESSYQPVLAKSKTVESYPLLSRHALKSIPSTVEIYQYDSSPLGNRQPLLLVHGLLGEFHPSLRWKQLADYLSAEQAFQDRYKIYLARYNTNSRLEEAKKQFTSVLPKLAPDGNLTIVAISMSGKIVHDSMSHEAVNDCVSRVLTLGAFFHGSPLFCSDWMAQTIRRRHRSLLCQADRLLAYRLYFARHKNLLLDYAWDDVDKQMPPPKHDSTANIGSAGSSSGEAADDRRVDQKFIVYAGYVHNSYIPARHGSVRMFLASPLAFLWTTLPAHFGREHQALRFLNALIAGSVPRDPVDGSDVIYPFNDGISPISSSLLLRKDFCSRTVFRDEKSFKDIRAFSEAKRARLFENTDHLTFIENRQKHGRTGNVADVISAAEKPRPMFAWILKDLLSN
jgi:hypothetical protein